jgi:Sec-independent protein secretion pathway component TatC
VVALYFAPQLIIFLKAPLNLAKPLVYTGLGDAFFITLKLALMVGIVETMPVLVWQLWAFVSPGLTPEERRIACLSIAVRQERSDLALMHPRDRVEMQADFPLARDA